MLPRDQGGVVDSNLKVSMLLITFLLIARYLILLIQVYATRNIYVVDASVIPLVSSLPF